MSHPLGSIQSRAWQSDDAPQVPGTAPLVGDVCRAAPHSTHPASETDLEGVVGSWHSPRGGCTPHSAAGAGVWWYLGASLVSNGSCTI